MHYFSASESAALKKQLVQAKASQSYDEVVVIAEAAVAKHGQIEEKSKRRKKRLHARRNYDSLLARITQLESQIHTSEATVLRTVQDVAAADEARSSEAQVGLLFVTDRVNTLEEKNEQSEINARRVEDEIRGVLSLHTDAILGVKLLL